MRSILALLVLSYSVSALAEEESLFPELEAFVSSEPAVNTEKIQEQTDEVVSDVIEETEKTIEDEDLFKNIEEPETSSSEPATEENSEEEEEEDNKEQYILWTIDNVNATITPNPVTSFCSAGFGVVNLLKKELKEFSGSFTFGDMTKEFKFTNLGKEKASGYKYMFVGTACEQILNIPELNIKTCKVDGWSEKKCKEKVKYLQLGENEATIK